MQSTPMTPMTPIRRFRGKHASSSAGLLAMFARSKLRDTGTASRLSELAGNAPGPRITR